MNKIYIFMILRIMSWIKRLNYMKVLYSQLVLFNLKSSLIKPYFFWCCSQAGTIRIKAHTSERSIMCRNQCSLLLISDLLLHLPVIIGWGLWEIFSWANWVSTFKSFIGLKKKEKTIASATVKFMIFALSYLKKHRNRGNNT